MCGKLLLLHVYDVEELAPLLVEVVVGCRPFLHMYDALFLGCLAERVAANLDGYGAVHVDVLQIVAILECVALNLL